MNPFAGIQHAISNAVKPIGQGLDAGVHAFQNDIAKPIGQGLDFITGQHPAATPKPSAVASARQQANTQPQQRNTQSAPTPTFIPQQAQHLSSSVQQAHQQVPQQVPQQASQNPSLNQMTQTPVVPHPSAAQQAHVQAQPASQQMTQNKPTPTTTATNIWNSGNVPGINASTPMILKQGIPVEQAAPYIQHIIQTYAPNSPLNTPQNIQALAQAAYDNKLHPALLPLVAAAETSMMKPAGPGQTALATADQNANPWNAMDPGQQLHDYRPQGGLAYSIPRYGQDVSGGWVGPGWSNFHQNPTIPSFIQAQNPIDHPDREVNNMLQLAQQMGIGAK